MLSAFLRTLPVPAAAPTSRFYFVNIFVWCCLIYKKSAAKVNLVTFATLIISSAISMFEDVSIRL